MATRTVSNIGGLFNSTSTWVEGVVPTSADDIICTVTSGPLTVNVASACRSFDFTNYTNTLTMNAVLTASGAGGFTQTFVSGMTITGSSNIALTGNGAAITTNTKLIPNLSITANKTLNDDLNVINFTSGGGTFTGNAINCSGNWASGTSRIQGDTVINLIGTGTVSFGWYNGTGGLTINTSGGTLSGTGVGIGLSNSTLNYINGTLVEMKIKMVGTPITINGNGVEFETFDFYGQLLPSTINLSSEFKVKYFNGIVASTSLNPLTENQLIIAGAGALNVTDSMNLFSSILNNSGVIQYKPFNIAFQTGVTHTISSLNINGFQGTTSKTTLSASFCNFRSASPGLRANVNLLNPSTSMINNTNITDINFTGPTTAYKYLGGTITNSLNVVNITSMGTLTTERSSVYVN
jgi:hypothetical protein